MANPWFAPRPAAFDGDPVIDMLAVTAAARRSEAGRSARGGTGMIFEIIVGGVALTFSLICFGFFVKDAIRRSKADQVLNQAQETAQASLAPDAQESLNLVAVGTFAKALGEAFAKAGPGVLALIGSILFLLLAGEATNVYNLTGSDAAAGSAEAGDDGAGDPADPGNVSDTGTVGNDADVEVSVPVNAS